MKDIISGKKQRVGWQLLWIRLIIVMRLNNMGGLEGGVSQLEILIQPRSAIARHHYNQTHTLYLEKGSLSLTQARK